MIKRSLKALYGFMSSFRQSGTTSLLKEIAETHDVWVIVPRQEDKKEFGDKAISLEEIDTSKFRSLGKKPILFDNNTVLEFSHKSLSIISHLETQARDRDNLILSIKDEIKRFENKHGEVNLKTIYKQT